MDLFIGMEISDCRSESSGANLVTDIFFLAIGIGIIAGLRSFTAPAVVAWAAHFGWLSLPDSPLGFIGSTTAVAIFSLLAIGELVADKLSMTPNRTAPAPLLARIITGALCGACVWAAAGKSLIAGALVGGTAGVIGAFAGYKVRRRLVNKRQIHDFVVAVCEDLFAIGLGFFLVSR